jgi:hypothetical protein
MRPSPARMLSSSRRKLRQLKSAFVAVHAIPYPCAEPKHTAPFADFQFQAQVIHLCSPRSPASPGGPQYFSAVGGAHSGCYEAPPCLRKLCGPYRFTSALSYRSSVRHLGRNPASTPHRFPRPWRLGKDFRNFLNSQFRNRKCQVYRLRQRTCQRELFIAIIGCAQWASPPYTPRLASRPRWRVIEIEREVDKLVGCSPAFMPSG